MKDKKIWDVRTVYLCPIIGFCLTMAEQKRIVLKEVKEIGSRRNCNLTDMELHELLVGSISIESQIAERVQRFLENKYRREIENWKDKSIDSWVIAMDEMLNPDDFGGCIFISALYMDTATEKNETVYGKIHMYTHHLQVELAQAQREVTVKEKLLNDFREKYRSLKKAQKDKSHETAALKGRLRALEQDAGIAENRGRGNYVIPHDGVPLGGKGENVIDSQREGCGCHSDSGCGCAAKDFALEQANATIENLKARLEEYEKEILLLEKENKEYRKREGESVTWLNSARKDLDRFLTSCNDQLDECTVCGKNIDLCRRRVLVVGGLKKLEVLYRDLVGKMNGDFYYHDGDCHNGGSNLTELIRQSDIVICPVDVNSHAACLMVKKTCRKGDKPYYMVRKSSISTVYKTLIEAAEA
jgi:DNA repair exonuclease SbcCD ATPase subunit